MRAPRILALALCAVLMFCASACASAQQKTEKARAKDPKYQYNLGLVYLNQSNLNPANIDEAIKCFVKALSLDTQYYLAWNALGLAHFLKGNLTEAAKAYEKCLEIYPQFTEVHNNLGMIYQELNQLDRAETEFQKVLADAAYPTRELGFYNLAGLYVVQNKLELAYANIEKALQLKPRYALAMNRKGQILEQMGKTDEAVAAYEQAVKSVPDDVQFSFNLAAAYFKAGEFAKSRNLFVKIAPLAMDADMKARISQYLKDLAGK